MGAGQLVIFVLPGDLLRVTGSGFSLWGGGNTNSNSVRALKLDELFMLIYVHSNEPLGERLFVLSSECEVGWCSPSAFVVLKTADL